MYLNQKVKTKIEIAMNILKNFSMLKMNKLHIYNNNNNKW